MSKHIANRKPPRASLSRRKALHVGHRPPSSSFNEIANVRKVIRRKYVVFRIYGRRRHAALHEMLAGVLRFYEVVLANKMLPQVLAEYKARTLQFKSGTHAIKVMVRGELDADDDEAYAWGTALERAIDHKVPSSKLPKYLAANGGINRVRRQPEPTRLVGPPRLGSHAKEIAPPRPLPEKPHHDRVTPVAIPASVTKGIAWQPVPILALASVRQKLEAVKPGPKVKFYWLPAFLTVRGEWVIDDVVERAEPGARDGVSEVDED